MHSIVNMSLYQRDDENFANKTVERLTTAAKRVRFVHRTNLQTSSRHLQTVYVLGTWEFQNLSLAHMAVTNGIQQCSEVQQGR